MKTKLLVALLVVMMIFSLSGNVLAEKHVLKLGILSAAGGLEDQAVQKIAAVAAEKSGGQLEIQVFPAAQLGNFISQMESLAMGTQAIVWGDLGWLGNFVKDYQIQIMPYAFRSQAHLDKFMDSPLALELEKQLEGKGYLLLSKHAYQLPKVTVSKKPIFTPADLQGIKMRLPEWPIAMKAWEALGTNVTIVSWGEVYLALAQGVADAMECGFEFIYPAKFQEVAKYITRTNHLYGCRGAIIGKVSYDKLPADMQQVLKEACLAGEKHYNELVEQARVEHTKKILASGAFIIEVDTTPFKEKVLPIVDTLESEGFWSKRFFKKVQEIE
jgi:tripartite ATP-independent transporter DctP family solute receptor